jgi:TPR repeat protein
LLLGDNGIPQKYRKRYSIICKRGRVRNYQRTTKIGKVFFYGDYLPQDFQQAFKWLNHLATRINSESAYLLALYYDRGVGIEVDTWQALKWHEIAASQGIKDAYIPAAALYWREFTQNDNPELLAKSYLWTQASC